MDVSCHSWKVPLTTGLSRYAEGDLTKPRLEVAVGSIVSKEAALAAMPSVGTSANTLPPDTAEVTLTPIPVLLGS